MRAKRTRTMVAALGCAATLAGAAGAVLTQGEDERARDVAVRVAPALVETPRDVPSLEPPARAVAGASASTPDVASVAAANSDTWAALPTSLDDAAPDEDEVLARALLGAQLIAWLAEEDDPDAALIWAEQIGEVAPWLQADARARLLAMAEGDPLEARRQAASVALGRLAAVERAPGR